MDPLPPSPFCRVRRVVVARRVKSALRSASAAEMQRILAPASAGIELATPSRMLTHPYRSASVLEPADAPGPRHAACVLCALRAAVARATLMPSPWMLALVIMNVASASFAWRSVALGRQSLRAASSMESELGRLREEVEDHDAERAAAIARAPTSLPERGATFKGEIDIDAATIDRALEEVIPQFLGWRGEQEPMRALKVNNYGPRTELAMLGFRSGDVVLAVNGFDVTTPEEARSTYERMRTSNHLDIRVLRGSKTTTLYFYVVAPAIHASR